MEKPADLLKKMKLQTKLEDDEDDEIMGDDDHDAYTISANDDTSVIATHTVSGEDQSMQPRSLFIFAALDFASKLQIIFHAIAS